MAGVFLFIVFAVVAMGFGLVISVVQYNERQEAARTIVREGRRLERERAESQARAQK